MPTQIHNPRLGSRERYFARQAVNRLGQQTRQLETLTVPWLGWVPDLPTHIAGWRGYRDGRGLVPISYEGRGMFLRHDDGFARIDAEHQVGGAAAAPALPNDNAGAGGAGNVHGHPGWLARPITMQEQYLDSANPRARQRLAIVSGTEAGGANYDADILMVRISAAGDWVAVFPVDYFPAPAGVPECPEGDREALWDSAVFPFGCPGATIRKDFNNANSPITGPVTIMCNADENGPVDNVLVTPCNAAAGGGIAYDVNYYDELIPEHAAPFNEPYGFKATSCESFDGRMHFLGTVETSAAVTTRNYQRHRWSAVGTAYPDESLVGSGYLDFPVFQDRGLRIESLGNKLALYFGDGVAFQIPTGAYFDAYRPQIISRSRGLMSTHALCVIDPERHFGIFNDGWYFLDSSGRWSEAGTLILEETKGKRYELNKWKQAFYDDLDYDNKHRIVCVYDRFRKIVRIAYTSSNASDNNKILNYHWPTDTCWQDQYSDPLTMWGLYDRQTREGITWDEYGLAHPGASGQWDNAIGTWDSYGPKYIDGVVVHGHLSGLIHSRDPSISTYDGRSPIYLYTSHQYNRNENPLQVCAWNRLGVEYMNLGGSSMQLTVHTDESGASQQQTISTSEGGASTIQNGYGHFRLQGSELGFSLSGWSPVAIRSIVPEIMVYGTSDREGQV